MKHIKIQDSALKCASVEIICSIYEDSSVHNKRKCQHVSHVRQDPLVLSLVYSFRAF